MNKTQIEWVKNPDGSQGYTWNPITGCLNHTPEGLCLGGMFPCYAYKLANGRLKQRYLANHNYIGQDTGLSVDDVNNLAGIIDPYTNPFYPRFWPERIPRDIFVTIKQIDKVRESPKGIFVCDMGELFGDWIPREWIEAVFRVIRFNPWHRFYLLTKQPQNLAKWSPFPDNCWVGVTVCNDKMLDVAVDKLEDIQAQTKYISFEPLLERMTLSLDYAFYYSGVSWVIIGAQTKPYKPPKIKWIEEIIRAADKAGIPVFLKDSLRPLLATQECFGDKYAPLPFGTKTGELRQEMPSVG